MVHNYIRTNVYPPPHQGRPVAALWWVSFADPDRPSGEQFLGVAVVRAWSLAGACLEAGRRGCNPGGQACGFPIAPAQEQLVSESWRGRLLTRQECAAVEAEIVAGQSAC